MIVIKNRIRGAYRSILSQRFARRIRVKRDTRPYISFTFDDFPCSAVVNGGAVLSEYGICGTFYVSMGRLNCDSPSGKLADVNDLQRFVDSGNELGCHTFDHLDGWSTNGVRLVESIRRNQAAVERIMPGMILETFAYPINGSRPKTKRIIGEHFLCCRGGGQTYNRRHIDMNMILSCFLDLRNRNDLSLIKSLIDMNNKDRGWLVFATHDVQKEPSRYGCTIDFFREIVAYCARSGAEIFAVARSCREMGLDRQSEM